METIEKHLDSDSIQHKLDALKRLIAMISKGKDASSMFPYVVKNVVSPNNEVKKLVYMFLTHYAENKPDEALLSISHFQKDMSDKNQFIRAAALRVLSSIRVPLIVQIVMMSIRKCATDPSQYVRKAAALAVCKVHGMSEDEKDGLVSLVEQLLNDSSTIVLGAAVYAFNEVCPDKYELLHRHYRKICRLLIDCDEWGQVAIINVFLRYARANFVSPFSEGYKKKIAFYSKDEDSEDDEDDNIYDYDMDPDHRLLLKSVTPLLQSRNNAVVLSIASLYYHVAPVAEFGAVVKSLIRILHSTRESQYVILTTISAMAVERGSSFHPYLTKFFISGLDPPYIRDLKLNILSTLATESNAPTLMREFRTYIKDTDKVFVKQTIHSIGRVASSIPAVAEDCLKDLLQLINAHDEREEVIAEAVIIMRFLLQQQAGQHAKIIKKLARLLDTIKVPVARASVIWLVGEYHKDIAGLAPEVFRKLTLNFINESSVAKLQTLNLGVKLHLDDSLEAKYRDAVSKILTHALHIAKYDMTYDVRDRSRLLNTLLFGTDDSSVALREHAKTILLAEKKAPAFETRATDLGRFQLGAMSHLVNHTAYGYFPLPDFPTESTPSSVRDVKEDTSRGAGYGWGGPMEAEEESEEESDEEASDFYGSEASEESDSSDSDDESGSDESGSESGSESESEESEAGAEAKPKDAKESESEAEESEEESDSSEEESD